MNQEQWQRYIDNTGTPEERKAALQWLQQQPPAAWEKMLAAGWQDDAPPMPAAADARLFAALAAHPAIRQPHKGRLRRLWWAAAASVAILLATLGWWTLRPAQRQLAAGVQQLQNVTDHVRLVTLPEGSRVWLAPGAVLTVPNDLGAGKRELQLNGEAYFEVRASTAHPLKIYTGRLQTIVLGTHFNIEAYAGEPEIKVSLTAGKVAVRYAADNGNDSTLILYPGNRIVYKTAQQKGFVEPFSPAMEAAWQRGALVLSNVPLTAVFHRLEKRFNRTIVYKPQPAAPKYFTASYENVPLEVILRNIAFIHNLHYRMQGDSIIIH